MTDSFMRASLHDPEQVRKDGTAVIQFPGARPATVIFGYPTPTHRRARRTIGRGERLRRDRWRHVNRNWARYLLKRIDREMQMREIEAILEQLAAEGEIIKNPDGTYQALPPTLADKMHARRREARP